MVKTGPISPFTRPPLTRRQILIARITGVVGLILVTLSFAAVAAAIVGGSQLDRDKVYVWRTGSELFISNNAREEVADCTLQAPTENRWVTIDKRSRTFFVNFKTNGKWAKRFASGPIKITCNHTVGITSGPVLWLLPIAATPWPFVAGLVLVTHWYWQRGGRYTSIFFGGKRPYQPKIR